MRTKIMAEERKKGKSLLALPSEYIVLDLETTGYDPYWNEIIEICAIKCVDHEPVKKIHTFINPNNNIPKNITNLTGITNEMVIGAPKINEVLPEFHSFVGNDIILGQCVYFDINFIHDAYIYQFGDGVYSIENNYVDLNRIAKKIVPGLENYKLSTIASSFGFDTSGAHRADFDCEITNLCYKMCKEVASCHPDPESLFRSPKKSYYKSVYEKVKACDVTRNTDEVDPTHPFYDTTCVFTGKLSKCTREEAMQFVVNIGGYCGDTVTKKTNYLIMGDYSYCDTIKDGKTGKHKKAEKYKSEGQDIEIISESVFYDMILEHQ
ncbi:exonuclease [Acetobacterium malicum]|uniref:Exonuclease n=1 Tax=Acetobacterium malicum TaxID=52692 RepID=A0ABR6Z261_9FIRM|nr:exonuclease domain-containing protein [Acetobacterium malicum]MBC3901498.1 exonuclease [Acetobacterium malicum]